MVSYVLVTGYSIYEPIEFQIPATLPTFLTIKNVKNVFYIYA